MHVVLDCIRVELRSLIAIVLIPFRTDGRLLEIDGKPFMQWFAAFPDWLSEHS